MKHSYKIKSSEVAEQLIMTVDGMDEKGKKRKFNLDMSKKISKRFIYNDMLRNELNKIREYTINIINSYLEDDFTFSDCDSSLLVKYSHSLEDIIKLKGFDKKDKNIKTLEISICIYIQMMICNCIVEYIGEGDDNDDAFTSLVFVYRLYDLLKQIQIEKENVLQNKNYKKIEKNFIDIKKAYKTGALNRDENMGYKAFREHFLECQQKAFINNPRLTANKFANDFYNNPSMEIPYTKQNSLNKLIQLAQKNNQKLKKALLAQDDFN